MKISYLTVTTYLLIMASTEVLARKPPPEEALNGQLLWGRCRIGLDPAVGEEDLEQPVSLNWPMLCVQPKTSAHSLFYNDRASSNLNMLYIQSYAGLHLSRIVSFHASYRAQRLFTSTSANDSDSTSPTVVKSQSREYTFLQLGNPALHKVRFSVGEIALPFGLNYEILPEILTQAFRHEAYWRSLRYGARLHFDSMVSSSYDLAIVSDMVNFSGGVPKREHKKAGQSTNAGFVARTSFDIAAMDGFRFLVSGYGDRAGERRVGVGLLNKSQRGDVTSFEWVRLLHAPKISSAYMQNFRLNFASAFRDNTRWVFEFESERSLYRMGVIGFDFRLPDYGLLRFMIGVQNGWYPPQNDFVFVSSSLQLAL